MKILFISIAIIMVSSYKPRNQRDHSKAKAKKRLLKRREPPLRQTMLIMMGMFSLFMSEIFHREIPEVEYYRHDNTLTSHKYDQPMELSNPFD